jgi:glycosyltransferase involved in cell wall biosynthesis
MGGLIVDEWIEGTGGALKVLDAMLEAFPNTPVRCLWNDENDRYRSPHTTESWIARTPLRRHKALALGITPLYWRFAVERARPDWVLVGSHSFAHHANFGTITGGVPKYVYVHTPARYVWNPELDDRGNSRLASAARPALRRIDKASAQRPSSLAANSNFVRSRIEKAWGRDSTVIYPPVDVESVQAQVASESLAPADEMTMGSLPDTFLLAASRFVPYKRIDAVIALGHRAKIPVIVAGAGPDEERLRALAAAGPSPVHFISRPSDGLLYQLYSRALAYVFPAIEDFGIMPVEAMAAGARVLVNRQGGASESVVSGISGVHFDPDDVQDGVQALEASLLLDPHKARERALEFSTERFVRELQAWVEPDQFPSLTQDGSA